MTLAQRLKQARETKGLTIEQICKDIEICPAEYEELEKGRDYYLSIHTFHQLAKTSTPP